MKKLFHASIATLLTLSSLVILPTISNASNVFLGCALSDMSGDSGLSAESCSFTDPPILSAPVSDHSYGNVDPLTISFLLPDSPEAGSITLTFTPAEGDPILLNLRDASPDVVNTFELPLTDGFGSTIEVISASQSTIPPGTYTVTIAYSDTHGHDPASASAENVTIVDGTVDGTVHFHIFTDTNADGRQTSLEDDGFDGDVTLTIAGEDTTETVDFDDNGNVDADVPAGSYVLSVNPPDGYKVTGGRNRISATVVGGETTNAGHRGIVDEDTNPPTSHSSSNVNYGGTSHSSSRSSSSSSSSSPRTYSGTTSSSSSSHSSTTNNTATTTPVPDDLPTPQAQSPACLRQGTASQFPDMSNNTSVAFLSGLSFGGNQGSHLIHGYSNGNFGPNNVLTRFELLKIAMGSNCIGGGNSSSFTHRNTYFIDVPQDDSEVSKIIGEAYSRGIVTGIGNRFFPDKAVTVAEMIKMLFTSSAYFYHGQPLRTLTVNVGGAPDSTFSQALEYASRLHVLPPVFTAKKEVTRLEMISFLTKFIQALRSVVIAN